MKVVCAASQVDDSDPDHFMPDDDDRAREIMNAFFAPTLEDTDHAPCALIVPSGRDE
jgi:hypothetical protein